MKYIFHPAALAEYAAAVQYYDENRTQLTQAFIDAVKNTIYRIRESPTSYQTIDEDVQNVYDDTWKAGQSDRLSA